MADATDGQPKYRGVTWIGQRHQKWAAQVKYQGRLYNLGHYDTPEVAARVRDVGAKLIQGGDAALNFDGQPPPGVTEADIRQRIESIERRWRA